MGKFKNGAACICEPVGNCRACIFAFWCKIFDRCKCGKYPQVEVTNGLWFVGCPECRTLGPFADFVETTTTWNKTQRKETPEMKKAHPVKKAKIADWLFFSFVIVLLVALLCSCTTGEPKSFVVNGVTKTHTEKKILGIPYHTQVEEHKTKEQKLDDLDVETETRKQENKLVTEERQKTAAFWGGVIFFALAVGFVFAGYFLQGWKFFGGAALVSFGLGVAAWSFESVVPYLKYPAYGIGAAVVLWTMWKLKEFNLFDKLKNSEKGKIL